jgi:hypothetical protein
MKQTFNMMFVFNLVFMLGIILPALFSPSDAFHVNCRAGTKIGSPKISSSLYMTPGYQAVPMSDRFALASENQEGEGESSPSLRDKLRKATGFSLTALRSTWRAATGISLTAIYASALAASGLWIRKVMSAVLSIFPAWVGDYKLASI